MQRLTDASMMIATSSFCNYRFSFSYSNVLYKSKWQLQSRHNDGDCLLPMTINELNLSWDFATPQIVIGLDELKSVYVYLLLISVE
ncbi:CLUMA_CG007383, isoform A [Clunio marinus]|uniref:CLUMA_CG007383, isoform A n=1 Tax=Clunio marinus TaxID=568069 RepID=A0A1J1I0I1_9DIPT|nr:CLUMA_CG007383, isoform A [Clunio marinus]